MKESLEGRNIPFYGLVAFALVSPISIAATNAAWVTTLLLWGYKTYLERPRPRDIFPRTELNTGFGILFLASFLSVWASLDFWASVVEFRSLGLMVIYFLFCWNIESLAERKKLVFCLLGATILTAVFGIVQHTTGWDYTGYYDPTSGKAGSFFGLHLTFGEYLVLTTCLVGGLVLFGNLSAPLLAAGIGLSVLMMVGIVASGSKGSVLGFIAGALVLLALRGKRVVLGVCGAVLLTVVLAFALRSWGPVHDIVFQFQVDAQQTDGPMASNTRRIYMWWTGLRISANHLLHGVGLHAMESIYPAFRHPLALEPNQWHLHNQYIHIGATRGLFGLTGLLYILLAAFRACLRRLKWCEDPWDRGIAGGVLAGLAGFLVCGLTEYCWGDSEVLMLVYMYLGLVGSIPIDGEPAGPSIDSAKKEASRSERNLSRIEKVGLMGVLAGIVLLSFLVPVTVRPVTMRVLELALGSILLWLSSRAVATDRPQASWNVQGIACLTVFAAYTFTRLVWVSAEEFFLANMMSSLPLLTVVAALTAVLTVLVWVATRKVRLSLFDLCVFGSLLLWGVSAWATHVLLALATGGQTVLVPPLLVLLPLLAFVFMLYSLVRFSYGGGRTERILLSCIALSMLIHAFR